MRTRHLRHGLTNNMPDSTLGPTVLLVRTSFDGDICREWLPAVLALESLASDPDNGEVWSSGRVLADDVDMSQWDKSA